MKIDFVFVFFFSRRPYRVDPSLTGSSSSSTQRHDKRHTTNNRFQFKVIRSNQIDEKDALLDNVLHTGCFPLEVCAFVTA